MNGLSGKERGGIYNLRTKMGITEFRSDYSFHSTTTLKPNSGFTVYRDGHRSVPVRHPTGQNIVTDDNLVFCTSPCLSLSQVLYIRVCFCSPSSLPPEKWDFIFTLLPMMGL